MAEPIARVHVNDFEPEVYRGDDALETALSMARQMREDFPGAVVGVSYNPEASEAKKRRIFQRMGMSPDQIAEMLRA